MKPAILVAGSHEFHQNVNRRLSDTTLNTTHIERPPQHTFEEVERPIDHANVIFIHSEPHLLPVAQFALRKAKHVVLFGAEKCEFHELETLLELAIESKSYLVNGDSLLFNPVIFPMIKSFESTEMTTLVSNRFRKYISRRQIFSCIEFLLYSNKSPLKNIFAKGVRLNGKRLNVLHARLEFENEVIAVLELSNTKENPKLQIESAGNGNWMDLDLLTFNGHYYHYADEEQAEVKPPKQIFPQDRSSLSHLIQFVELELEHLINPHRQFENSLQTAKAIQTIEEQLRRGLPNFTHFEK